MRKFTVFFLSLITLLTLTACGKPAQAGSSPEPPDVSDRTPPAGSQGNEVDAPAPEGGGQTSESHVLVVYFSATGSTERVAGYIAETLNADTFALIPVEPYTSTDLNWRDQNSRVSREHNDESLRDVELAADTVDNWADYDTIFIGYPIWWGIAAWPTDSFVRANDFTGKTVIPFCTSSSSGLGQSGELLARMAGTGNWQTGMRFSSGVSQNEVSNWVKGLNIQ